MSENPHKATRPLHVFLCHASEDKPTVRTLYQQLHSEGIDAWLDEEELLAGQDWQQEIRRVVRDSDAVIICLSQKSNMKVGYVQKELTYILDVASEQPEGTIFVIPLRLEECAIPERLSRWHWANYFEPQGFDRLLRSLRRRSEALGINQSSAPTTPSVAPTTPHDTINMQVRDYYQQITTETPRLHDEFAQFRAAEDIWQDQCNNLNKQIHRLYQPVRQLCTLLDGQTSLPESIAMRRYRLLVDLNHLTDQLEGIAELVEELERICRTGAKITIRNKRDEIEQQFEAFARDAEKTIAVLTRVVDQHRPWQTEAVSTPAVQPTAIHPTLSTPETVPKPVYSSANAPQTRSEPSQQPPASSASGKRLERAVDPEHVKQVLAIKNERLKLLELRQAMYGSSTPPEVLMEIKDLQCEIAELKDRLANST